MKEYFLRIRGESDPVQIKEYEYHGLMHRYSHSGRNFARFVRDNGEVFFLEHITHIIVTGEDDPVEEPETAEELAKEKPSEDENNDLEKRRKAALEEMIRKSNCKHPEDKQMLFKTETKQGVRYFTLCEECGGNRSRFIAAANLEDEEMANAKAWISN